MLTVFIIFKLYAKPQQMINPWYIQIIYLMHNFSKGNNVFQTGGIKVWVKALMLFISSIEHKLHKGA